MKNELIKYAPLFTGLSDGDREVLAAGFAEGQSAGAASLLKAGDRAEAVYLIGQGFVSLSTPSGQNIATLGPGSLMGEASLFRAATLELNAAALSDVQFWKLTDRALRELILQRPSIGIRLSRNFGSLLVQMEDYLVQRLAATPELGGLQQHTLQAVAKRLQPVEVHAPDTIFRAGETPAGLYLVENGGLELRAEGRADPVRPVEPGRLIGAAALLTAKPALEAAVAVRDSLLWLLPAEAFQAISAQHPGLRRSLARSARALLNRSDQGVAVTRLAQMPMFAEAPPAALQSVAQRMVIQPVPAGERVYTVGELGDALYLIESGEVVLSAENATGVVEELARIDQGGMFGEMSLLMGRSRAEDAVATRNTNLWILYKADLDELATQHPALSTAMSQGLATKLASEEQDQGADRFKAFDLFAGLGAAELAQVAEYLRPTRYRAGEQLYRSTSPADTLFLLEKGHVRIQPLSGGSWVLGPGETFGERALLTNQPHNAAATAETDVDVWTLAKSDFDMLMVRYPTLAISMSRMLSQRLAQAQTGMADGVNSGPVYVPADASTNLPSRRRGQAVAYPGLPLPPPSARKGPGFVEWFSGLSRGKKIAVAMMVLLLIWLIGIAAPAALLSMIRGSTSVASGADLATHSKLFNALNAAYSMGSYELAAEDKDLADALAMADKQVPPTPVFTPAATDTPIPTPTFTPTPIPTATSLPTATPTLRPFVQEVIPPTDTPTAEAPVQAAAVARAWDPRLDKLGVYVEEAAASPGQQYWRLVEVRWEDEQQAGGKHHIYVELLDENGNRVVGNPVTVFWGDGSYTNPTEDKTPPDFGWNYQMYAAGNAYNVKVEGMPSDVLHGAGMGDTERPKYGIHTAFYLTYKKTTK